MAHQENIVVIMHRKLIMGRRVKRLANAIASLLPPGVTSLLDVGAGTGEMAVAISSLRNNLKVDGVDVYIRPKVLIPVKEYDGIRLPYEDNSFDAVMLVDVLHHCDEPNKVLEECARVSRGYIVIKDHVADSWLENSLLIIMDWVGNRAHGVVLPYKYLSTTDWIQVLKDTGLTREKSVDKINIYPPFLEKIFGGRLHCCWLLHVNGKIKQWN